MPPRCPHRAVPTPTTSGSPPATSQGCCCAPSTTPHPTTCSPPRSTRSPPGCAASWPGGARPAQGRQPAAGPHPRDHSGHPRRIVASKTPATAPRTRHERPARPKARHSPAKPQARQAAPVIGVRPESGTPIQKNGHKAHTRTKQFPYSERLNIRITIVTCLYVCCPAAVRPSRNHLTNVVLAAKPVVIDPGLVGDGGVNHRNVLSVGAIPTGYHTAKRSACPAPGPWIRLGGGAGR
jgi:hypothetical protein